MFLSYIPKSYDPSKYNQELFTMARITIYCLEKSLSSLLFKNVVSDDEVHVR